MRVMRLVAVGLFGITLGAGAQTIQISKDNRSIAITTTDQAEAIADRAVVSIGFVTYGTDQDGTYAEASKISNAIMTALTDAGIKAEAIESTEQSLSAIDDNDKVRYSKGIRFVVSQSWMVTVAAQEAANTLHKAITAGANNSGSISWQLSDDSKLESEAAEKALVHARHLAEQMTKGLNVTLGPLVYASNQMPSAPPPPIPLYAPGRMRAMAKSVKPLAIRPDKITKSATVYAVFSLQ